MTLLYATGWDLCTAVAGATLDGWVFSQNGSNGTGTIQTTNGRNGGVCLTVNNGTAAGAAGFVRQFSTQGAGGVHTFVGLAHLVSVASRVGVIVALADSGTAQVDLRLNSTGSVSVTRNGTVLGTSTTGLFGANVYHYLEMDVVIASGTAGSVTVRMDMSTVLTITGVNTQASGNQFWNQLQLQQTGGIINDSTDYRYDDLYVCDSNGSAPDNTLLGDIAVRALLPNSSGTNAGFSQTGGSGGGHYTSVNEKPDDGDTSYVSSSVIGTIDTYAYPALTGNVTSIYGVLAKPVARKDDAGNRHITARYRTAGGSEANFGATDITLTSTYAQGLQIQETNPVTSGAWLASDISGGEFGPAISS